MIAIYFFVPEYYRMSLFNCYKDMTPGDRELFTSVVTDASWFFSSEIIGTGLVFDTERAFLMAVTCVSALDWTITIYCGASWICVHGQSVQAAVVLRAEIYLMQVNKVIETLVMG